MPKNSCSIIDVECSWIPSYSRYLNRTEYVRQEATNPGLAINSSRLADSNNVNLSFLRGNQPTHFLSLDDSGLLGIAQSTASFDTVFSKNTAASSWWYKILYKCKYNRIFCDEIWSTDKNAIIIDFSSMNLLLRSKCTKVYKLTFLSNWNKR